MKPITCQATTVSGNPCHAQARPGKTVCAWHDGDLAQQRRAWSRKGGEQKSTQARMRRQLPSDLMTLREVEATLCRGLRKLEAGEMTPAVANALGGLGRSIAAVAEAGDFEERLSKLERRADVAEKRAG